MVVYDLRDKFTRKVLTAYFARSGPDGSPNTRPFEEQPARVQEEEAAACYGGPQVIAPYAQG